VRFENASEVLTVLERAAAELFDLENSVSRARGVIYACSVALQALAVAEVEERLKKIEEALECRETRD